MGRVRWGDRVCRVHAEFSDWVCSRLFGRLRLSNTSMGGLLDSIQMCLIGIWMDCLTDAIRKWPFDFSWMGHRMDSLHCRLQIAHFDSPELCFRLIFVSVD